MHWPFVSRKRFWRALVEQREEMLHEIQSAHENEFRALEEMERLSSSVANAIGLHMAKPYREETISGVTFPLFVSGYALGEMGKRMDKRQLAELVANEARKAVYTLLDDPASAVTLQRARQRRA